MKIITIDGPSGVGKGTISRWLARTLGWAWLDSGALYRLVAYQAQQYQIDPTDAVRLAQAAAALAVVFGIEEGDEPSVTLDGQVVTRAIRTEECGVLASKISAHPEVRQALLEKQRAFLSPQGLVADGRDMGTVVFTEAPVKIFLQARADVRALRRQHQLQKQGLNVNIAALLQEIEARDERDRTRAVAPLIPAKDALIIDTSDLTIEQVCQTALAAVGRVFDTAQGPV